MQTLEDVIAEVLSDLDRPDLIAVARNSARNVLYACHAISPFGRDIVEGAATAVTQATVSVLLPANFRKLSFIKPLDANSEQIQSISYMLKGAKPYVDYFGFIATTCTYNLQGGSCFIQHTPLAVPSYVQLVYYAYPTFTVDSETGAVSTDSWMLAYYSDYFKAKLAGKLAAMTSNNIMIQVSAQEAESALYRLLASELATLPEA